MSATVVIRGRYAVRGIHVHVRIFTAPAGGVTGAYSGALVFRLEEWPAVRAALEADIDWRAEDQPEPGREV